MNIPDPGDYFDFGAPDDIIIRESAERPQEEEAPETQELFISFARYNKDECEISTGMDNKMGRKALQTIRDIGVQIRSALDFDKKLPKLEVVSISNTGEYRKLYKGLADLPDAEIQEAKIDKDKGRLFFFMVERIFYVIAVKGSHYETAKQRR